MPFPIRRLTVYLDRMMADLDGRYPGYGFAQHKGYCTQTSTCRGRPGVAH
ncbi:MAG: hypothetical protein WCD12_21135 [Candidatus Binatus sp.]